MPDIKPCFSFKLLTFLNKVHLAVFDSNENPLTLDLDKAILLQPSTEAYFFAVLTDKIFH